jgi:hypothetical protein
MAQYPAEELQPRYQPEIAMDVRRVCACIVTLLVSNTTLAAQKAAAVVKEIESVAESAQSRIAITTANARKVLDDAAIKIRACELPINEGDDIDARIRWVEDVTQCLETARATLQVQANSSDADVRGAALAARDLVGPALTAASSYKATLAGEKDFIGITWGVGVGYSHGFDDIVDDAQIIDGLVRVTKDLTEQPRVILEFHSYRWCHKKRVGDVSIEQGCGPFAAVASRDDQAVSGVAAGWMYGWKTGTGADAKGFSIGIGVIVDSAGKKLGEGYVEGQPPPTGATSVFLKEESIASGVIFFTRTF